MSSHHDFSPSGLERKKFCPGSHRLTKGIEDPGNVYAAEGTMLHDRLTTMDFTDLTGEQIECLEFCNRWIDHVKGDDYNEILIEQTVSVFDNSGEMLLFGTLDYAIIQKSGFGILADFKFGRTPVSADSLQLKTYALAMFQKYWDLKAIWAYIVQPRLGAVEHVVYHSSQQEEILEEVELIINGCNGKYPALQSGTHCRYCRAKDVCSAYKISEGKK